MSTILVVEDDPRIQKALQRQFTMEGYTVHVAGDGAEGLATCKTLRPTGVVLDHGNASRNDGPQRSAGH